MFYYGIVEDIDDPNQLGRVRVRVFGIHTHDKSIIATDSLPWASVVQPTTSAANSGIGMTPRLLNGTLVMLTFADGESMQLPIVIGSIPSEIRDHILTINGVDVPRDPENHGFQDPAGKYPTLASGSNDLPKAAKDDTYLNSNAYVTRANGRIIPTGEAYAYPVAAAADIPTVAQKNSDATLYTNSTWSEPEPAEGNVPEYPENQVRTSELGITEEWDDSFTTGPRIHTFHPEGTYEEIISDGSKTIKVVGQNHEIYIKGSNVYFGGDVNVTIKGNKRELITGDYIQEVEGNVYYNHKKSVQSKIGEDVASEIGSNHTVNIGGNETRMVSGSQTETTVGNEYHIVNGTQATQVSKNATFQYSANYTEVVTGDKGSTVMGNNSEMVMKNDTTLVNGNQRIGVTGNIDLDSKANITMDSSHAAKSFNINSGTKGAARIDDTADTGDAGTGGHFDTNSAGTDKIETGSTSVVIGD